MHRVPATLLSLIVVVLAVPAVAAEPTTPVETLSDEHQEGGHEAWQEHRNFFTAFGGMRLARAEVEPQEGALGDPAAGLEAGTYAVTPAFGLDYSYRVNKWLGAGAFFDVSVGTANEWMVGPCVFFFPWRGLFIELSPSLEFEVGGAPLFVARGAVGYEFELTEQVTLGVYTAVDVEPTRRDVDIVPGVTLGFGI